MSTAREGSNSNFSHNLGSDELYDEVCQPCELDGKLQEAVGLCTDCQEYLCQRCFDVHTLPTPMRNHKLLDKKQMVQQHVFVKKEDKSPEKCAVHEDEVIKYYCIDHCQLGCNDCITLNHRSCENVTYIPHAAKDLANNQEYKHVEKQLDSVVKRAKKINEDNKDKTESLETGCTVTVKMVHEFRKEIKIALDSIETGLVRKCKTLKSDEIDKLAQIVSNFKTTKQELHALLARKENLQNNKQNCNLYIVMMNAKEKLKLVEDRIRTAEKDQACIESKLKFAANKGNLDIMKPEEFGEISLLGTARSTRPDETRNSIREEVPNESAEYIQDINVSSSSDERTCFVTGLVSLSGNRLFIADCYDSICGNGNVKLVDVKQEKVITQSTLSSRPWGVAMVTNCRVAVTLPDDKNIAVVNVSASKLAVDRTLRVDGECYGVDYRDGKLAVSFTDPDKVQILTLQGRVLYTITNNKTGQALFNYPYYIAFGKDNSSVYVSNFSSNNVLHMNFDGTVLGTYRDSELSWPEAVLTDSSGNVYACGRKSNNIHQLTPGCSKVQVLLNGVNGFIAPFSISYNEAESRLYVGMFDNNNVKVYTVIPDSE